MTNALYAKGKEKILSGAINFPADTLKAALVKTAYAVSLGSHEFLTDLGANVLGTQTLASKAVTGGSFDAADVTYADLASGDTAVGVVIYKDTGVAGTSPLLVYVDTITGFPIATNGGSIAVQWDSGSNKVFAL